MRSELDELLERRSVGPAHRVRNQTRNELDALLRGVRAPLVRVDPLLGRQTARGGLQRRPQRGRAGGAVAVAAVAPAEASLHAVPEQRAQVLVDVLVPAV